MSNFPPAHEALELVDETKTVTFVSVDIDSPAALKNTPPWHREAPPGLVLPVVPAFVIDVPSTTFAIHQTLPFPFTDELQRKLKGDYSWENLQRFTRPMRFDDRPTVLSRQKFIFERPVLVKRHEHFGFITELTITNHVWTTQGFDPRGMDAEHVNYYGHIPSIFGGWQYVSAANPEGMERCFVAFSARAPTRASLSYSIGRLRERPGIWRRCTRYFEREPTPQTVEYERTDNGAICEKSVLCTSMESIDYRETSDVSISVDSRTLGKSRSQTIYCNPDGLTKQSWVGLRESSLTSVAIDYESKRVDAISSLPFVTTAEIF